MMRFMCSIILQLSDSGVFIAANRDEMLDRPWDAPAEYWPGICGGRDQVAGGTWMAINRHRVFAALLNREGTLGPAVGKSSRGKLPLLALAYNNAAEAAKAIAALNVGAYRSFNLVIADVAGAFLLRGFGHGKPDLRRLPMGVTMITSGDPNDMRSPRIARHLPRFRAVTPDGWLGLLAAGDGNWDEQLNISPRPNGFGTVCAAVVHLRRSGEVVHLFADGPPDKSPFRSVQWH